MTTATEARDALVGVFAGIDAEVYKTASSRVVAPAVVVAPGAPWWIPDRTFGPTTTGRLWRWEVTALVPQTDPQEAFLQIAALTEEVVGLIDADSTLGGGVLYAAVSAVGPPADIAVAESPLLGCIIEVEVQT